MESLPLPELFVPSYTWPQIGRNLSCVADEYEWGEWRMNENECKSVLSKAGGLASSDCYNMKGTTQPSQIFELCPSS